MAAAERRVNSSRRGMTVLGKVPVVPKPINLPSQRLENRGLFSDVDIVPRGTCWGRTGQFSGASGSKVRKSDAAVETPLKSGGDCENGVKVESKPVLPTSSKISGVKNGGGLLGTSIQLSSAKATISHALDKNGQIEELKDCNGYTHGSLDHQKQETTENPLQKSGDGYVRGVSVPPGFVHSGPQGNQPRAGFPSPDLQCNGVGAGMHPNVSQQNGLPSSPGASHHNGTKEREIIVIHMVGSPAFYGNYPPQLGYPDIYNTNGLYGNFPLQFGNFEPYFGFQGHGRLDGGAQISSGTDSDLFNRHEDFVCYEKECYQGRKKTGLLHGSFQENTFVGGAHRDVHETWVSHSSLKPRCASQKHLSRNAGRLRSLYHDGRLVPIEETSTAPVPEKRVTLLTKMSQPKLLTIKSLEAAEIREVAHAEYVVGSALLAYGDEGKAPETFEVDLVAKDGEVKKTVPSTWPKMTDKDRLNKEPELECKKLSVSTTACNDTCLHCKAEAAAHEGPALMLCQACKKTTLCESTSADSQCCLRPTKELPTESIGKSSSADGCAVEVKHIIFDADSSSLSALKDREDVSLSSSTEVADDKQLDAMILEKKSSTQNSQEGKGKQRLVGKKGVTNGKWKPKRPVGAAKVDFKVFAPKIRKAAGRKTTSKALVDECISEASSSSLCNEASMVDMGPDSIRSSQTGTCNKHQEMLSPPSLITSGNVPVNDSQDSPKEKPNGAAFVHCIASEGCVEKKKGRNARKTTLFKDCHNNVATVHDVESLVKIVFEDISNTEVQKQEPKDGDGTSEKAWRPKVPAALQGKSGIRVSKADVVSKKPELQGRKVHLNQGSTFSAESSEAAKEEQNDAQKRSSFPTSQLCNSEALNPNKSPSFEAPSTKNASGQQNLVFRKRSAEQAAVEHHSSGDASSDKESIGSPATFLEGEFGPELSKRSVDSSSADMNCTASASKYHTVGRRVYHVVEKFGGNYLIPSSTVPGKSHLAGNNRSFRKTSMQNQEELRKKKVLFSSGSSAYTESDHSEELSDSVSMAEIKSCQSQSNGVCDSGLAADQFPSSSGMERSKEKKYAVRGERLSAWKPKPAPKSGMLQDVNKKEDDNKNGSLIPMHIEGASKKIKDAESCSQVSATSPLHGGENSEEQKIENVCTLPFEPENVGYEPLKEIDHAVNKEDTSPVKSFESEIDVAVNKEDTSLVKCFESEINRAVNEEDTLPLTSIESEEVVYSLKTSKIVVSMDEVEHSSVLKHVEDVPKAESFSPASSCKEAVVVVEEQQESTQTCGKENAAGNNKPFFKKKNAMSYEKANRFHQMMFKKYKQTGHWKPKADVQSRASDRASRNVSKAPMQDVLVVA